MTNTLPISSQVCKNYAKKLDGYTGNILLTNEEIEEQINLIPDKVNCKLFMGFFPNSKCIYSVVG